MDFYSNEFMRLENFMEKYLPLKIQNQISQTLNGVMPANQRGRIKEYEDTKFLELREYLIHDVGLPDLVLETKRIVDQAKAISPQFNGIELEGPETKGLQEDQLMRHKHMAILHNGMNTLNPGEY